MRRTLAVLIGMLLALFVVLNLNDYLLTLLVLRLGLAVEGNPITSLEAKVLSVAVVIVVIGVFSLMYQKRIGVALLIAGLCLFYASALLYNLWVVSLP